MLITFPSRRSFVELEPQVIQVIMDRPTLEPLDNVMEEDIDDDLERNNNDREEEVIHEILHSDSIGRSHSCLVIEHPNLQGKERVVNQGQCISSIPRKGLEERFYCLLFSVIVHSYVWFLLDRFDCHVCIWDRLGIVQVNDFILVFHFSLRHLFVQIS